MLATILLHGPLQEISEAAFYFALGVISVIAIRAYVAGRR